MIRIVLLNDNESEIASDVYSTDDANEALKLFVSEHIVAIGDSMKIMEE